MELLSSSSLVVDHAEAGQVGKDGVCRAFFDRTSGHIIAGSSTIRVRTRRRRLLLSDDDEIPHDTDKFALVDALVEIGVVEDQLQDALAEI